MHGRGETSFGADYAKNLKLRTNIYSGLLPSRERERNKVKRVQNNMQFDTRRLPNEVYTSLADLKWSSDCVVNWCS